MPQHHTTADQVVFVGEWFSGWSELQRSDFLPSLLRELHPAHHINGGLPEHLSALTLGNNRPPSIFHCQVKLFHDWVSGWSSEERAKLVTLLRDADPSFGEKVDKAVAALDGGQQQPLEQQQQSLDVSNGDQLQHDLEQHQQLQQQVPPPLQLAAAVALQQQQQQQLEPEQLQLQVQVLQPEAAVAGAVVPPLAAAAAVAGVAGGPESDVDEALESSPSSTLSSPRPSEQHPDSGLDSPVGGEAEEDEGGHVVVMDDAVGAVLPVAGLVDAGSDVKAGEDGGGGDGME